MFAPSWSAKVEYQYYDFGSSRFIAPAALVPFGSFRNDEHTLKAGLNYRFNWGRSGGCAVLMPDLIANLRGRKAGLTPACFSGLRRTKISENPLEFSRFC